MRLLLHQARYELLMLARNRRARFFTLVFPVLFLVIFNGVFGGLGPRFYLGGIVTLSVVSACYATLVIGVTAQREQGVLKRRRATPVPAPVLILGQSLATVAMSLITTAVLLAITRAAYGVGLPAGTLAAVLLTVVCGSLAFCCLAYAAVTLIDSADAAQPFVQLTILPLYFVSGVWFPTRDLPEWLRRVGELFPIEHLATAFHRALAHADIATALAPGDLLTLAAWGAASALFASRRFGWLPREAPA